MFDNKRAIIVNDHLATLGGGERSSLAYARALKDSGFETTLYTSLQPPSMQCITDTFGKEFGDIPVQFIPWENRTAAFRQMQPDLFVNHSMMSVEANPAHAGLYVQMFPAEPLKTSAQPEAVQNLQQYDRMICISSYTQRHTAARWDYPPEKMHVLLPPIGRAALRSISRCLLWHPRRRRQIISIGRFNPRLQNKNQRILIEAFLEARKIHAVLNNWLLMLVGHVNPDDESQAYYEGCTALAAANPNAVRIHTALPERRLFGLLRKSFGYVHGAGAFVNAKQHPERCEHYGIAPAEAMACGCIPLVYHQGGYWDFLEKNTGGLAYHDRPSLVQGFADLANLYRCRTAAQMRRNNLRSVAALNQQHFTAQLKAILQPLFS